MPDDRDQNGGFHPEPELQFVEPSTRRRILAPPMPRAPELPPRASSDPVARAVHQLSSDIADLGLNLRHNMGVLGEHVEEERAHRTMALKREQERDERETNRDAALGRLALAVEGIARASGAPSPLADAVAQQPRIPTLGDAIDAVTGQHAVVHGSYPPGLAWLDRKMGKGLRLFVAFVATSILGGWVWELARVHLFHGH